MDFIKCQQKDKFCKEMTITVGLFCLQYYFNNDGLLGGASYKDEIIEWVVFGVL